jgi:nitrogenase molybdenum-iron protein alpha/beta subunit
MKPAQTPPTPDSLTGSILAIEGVRDAAVLLNGPTGCKFYHGAIAEGQLPRESSYDPLRFIDEFYFGQPRVPATYLDGDDYVFGASAKLERILPVVAAKGHALIAVVNSPGAALIGDDLDRFIHAAQLDIPCIAIESTGYSGTMEGGFQEAVIRTLESLTPPPAQVDERTVNLVGLSIAQKHWEGNIAELRRLLALCGVRVGATLCAGVNLAELSALRSARYNVIVHEEHGDAVSKWCESRLGLKTLRPCSGAPIGFDRTEDWVRSVCRALDASAQPAIEAIDAARIRAVTHIKRLNSLTGLPKGATFAIRAPGSIALPLSEWLHDYLGMVPVAIDPPDRESLLIDDLARSLADRRCQEALHASDFGQADCVFADGATLAGVSSPPGTAYGIEVALPSGGQIDVVDKCIVGAQGSLYLLEWILNILIDR